MSDCPTSATQLLALARGQGWRVRRVRKGFMAFPPDRSKPGVSVHLTYSDKRSLMNTYHDMKRSGLT